MAATATASSFDPQKAADSLRQGKVAAQRTRPGRIAQQAQRPDTPPALYANLGDIGQSGQIEPANNQNQWAQDEQRYRINAAKQAVLPEYSPSRGEAKDDQAFAEYEAAERQIRQEAEDADVNQLGPERGAEQSLRKYLADKAAQAGADRAKQKLLEYGVKLGEDAVLGAAETAEGAIGEETLGLLAWVEDGKTLARVGVTLFTKDSSDPGTTAGETAQYTANQVVRTLFPPYRFIFSRAKFLDYIWDLPQAITEMSFGVPIAMIIVTLVVSVIVMIAGGAGLIIYSVSGFPTL